MLVSAKSILSKARRQNYAVGAFNINNMEILQAVVNAAAKLNSPIMVQTSEGAIEYAGLKTLYDMVVSASEQVKIPVALHLDHGRNLDIIKSCLKVGYTSIMYDGSHLPFNDNIRTTKKVVSWAHRYNVPVEAELGTIGGAEDNVSARKIVYTDPSAAKEFVKQTGCDSLAVAIGTSHGAYKFAGSSKLNIKLLKEIRTTVNVPLVLHGASGIPQKIVRLASKYGAKLGNAHGVSDANIKNAVKNGINKVNIDSDVRLAFDAAIRKVLSLKPEVFDPRKILGPARELIQEIAEHRIKLLI